MFLAPHNSQMPKAELIAALTAVKGNLEGRPEKRRLCIYRLVNKRGNAIAKITTPINEIIDKAKSLLMTNGRSVFL